MVLQALMQSSFLPKEQSISDESSVFRLLIDVCSKRFSEYYPVPCCCELQLKRVAVRRLIDSIVTAVTRCCGLASQPCSGDDCAVHHQGLLLWVHQGLDEVVVGDRLP